MAVMTVNGLIDKQDLGVTLPHEHLFVDLSFVYMDPQEPAKKKYATQDIFMKDLHLLKYNPGLIRSNLVLDDETTITTELWKFKEAGGVSVVEQSSRGAGRREKEIRDISLKTGVHIILGGGFYLEGSLPDSITGSTEDDLADTVIDEIQTGIGDTGIRPGIIGEIGIGPVIGEWEQKLLKVAARAQKETGRALSIHVQAVPTLEDFSGELNGIEVLRYLENQGADISRVVICHTDAKINLEYLRKIVEIGAYAELDHFGKEYYFSNTGFLMARDLDRVLAIKELIDSGLAERILMSQDICLKTDLITYGGFGYAHILNNIIPAMKLKGISPQAIHTIMVENPKTLLDVQEAFL
jgi:phosphotriesterase-related protein